MLSWSSVLILISIDPTDSGKPAPWWRVWALPTVLRTPLSPNPCCGPYPWVLRKTDGPTLEVRPCTYMLMRMRGQRDTVFAEWELLIDGSQMSDCWINPVGTLAVLLNALFSFSILKYGPISFFSSHFILTLLLYVLYLFQIILLCGFLKLLLLLFFFTFDSCTIWLFGRNKNRTPVKPATTIWQLLSESLRVTEGPAFGP